jgi:hypothetical protein
MPIRIATGQILARILEKSYHPKLVEIVMWITHRYPDCKITSAWRPNKLWSGDSGIHMMVPGRAIDFEIMGEGFAIARDINDNWIYDPDRPNMKACLYHSVGLGWHHHVQAHDHTVMKGGKSDEKVSD